MNGRTESAQAEVKLEAQKSWHIRRFPLLN